MASNGSRGADFERKTRSVLEKAGYVVIRSAASKTGVDLVALSGERVVADDYSLDFVTPHVLLVQCKTDGRLDPGEWNTLYDMAMACDAVPVLARYEWVGRRRVPVFYVLTDHKVPHSRTRALRRLEIVEVSDAEQPA